MSSESFCLQFLFQVELNLFRMKNFVAVFVLLIVGLVAEPSEPSEQGLEFSKEFLAKLDSLHKVPGLGSTLEPLLSTVFKSIGSTIILVTNPEYKPPSDLELYASAYDGLANLLGLGLFLRPFIDVFAVVLITVVALLAGVLSPLLTFAFIMPTFLSGLSEKVTNLLPNLL